MVLNHLSYVIFVLVKDKESTKQADTKKPTAKKSDKRAMLDLEPVAAGRTAGQTLS